MSEQSDELWLELARQLCRQVRCDVSLTGLPLMIDLGPARVVSTVQPKPEKGSK